MSRPCTRAVVGTDSYSMPPGEHIQAATHPTVVLRRGDPARSQPTAYLAFCCLPSYLLDYYWVCGPTSVL
jgi:hypothetical protein